MQSNDIVNKYYNSCGCIYISELNIIDNIIHDNYIQLCKTHYLLSKEKSKFKLDKKNKLYIINSKKTDNIKKKKISYDNLKLLINDKNKNDEDSNKLIKFGKYKNQTYEYVYNTDKLYCYHLAYWKDNNLNNSNITNFINYIKLQV
jgi:hypothetical protein